MLSMGGYFFWKIVLRPVVKTMRSLLDAFRDQLHLRLLPMLHLVSVLRTLVHISEVGPPGHFVRCRREGNFVGV